MVKKAFLPLKSLSTHYLEPIAWYHLPFTSRFTMKPHMHPQYEIMYCEQGSFSVACYDAENAPPLTAHVSEKSFILLNNNSYHKLSIETPDAKIMNIEFVPVKVIPEDADPLLKKCTFSAQELFTFTPHLADLMRKNERFYVFHDSHEVGSTLLKLIQTLFGSDHPTSDLSVRLLITELFIDISYCWLDETYTPPVPAYVKKALLYIQHNFNKQLSVNGIAQTVGITAAYLQRLFKAELGESIHTTINKIRVEKAKKLLQDTTFTNSNIANLSGFGTRANLISALKKSENCTPQDFRQSVLQKQWSVKMPPSDTMELDE